MPGNIDRAGAFLLHLVGHHQHVVGRVDLRQQHHELVAAQPRHRVGVAQRPGQLGRDGLQQCVARFMAQAVVDLLEMVEVEEDDGEAMVPPARLGDLAIDFLGSQARLARPVNGSK